MLSDGDRNKLQGAYESVVDMLGVPVTWIQTKAPNATADVVAGFKTAGLRDEELINSFGVGAKIFTIRVSDIPLLEKMDRLTLHGERYTIDSVMPVHLNGVQVFWKAIVRGK